MSCDEDRLTQAILALASEYGRYGYRRITALLRQSGVWARTVSAIRFVGSYKKGHHPAKIALIGTLLSRNH